RSLGLSGPEDFAIPADAWEATMIRPYILPSLKLNEVRESAEEAELVISPNGIIKLNEVIESAWEAELAISPNGLIKSIITPGSWQKVELLGRGSFGSVYEGIS
ncbi:mitogen-activated protein kinase kinase kinase 1-like, partial [Trifolium medium]|nr:mitogen-activated protein kinase kinase kinase 1-like [Trifolium medium]